MRKMVGRLSGLMMAGAALALPIAAMAQVASQAVAKPMFTTVPAGDLPGTIPLMKGAKPVQPMVPEIWQTDGKGGRIVRNVAIPTLTPVLPDPAKATGAAVIVAPGGGFMQLSIDSEGYQVARWLADHGIAAFVLKYRLEQTPSDPIAAMRAMGAKIGAAIAGPEKILNATSEAKADGEAAVRLVRSRAKEWGIDPQRIGFVGFSAGAMTALAVGLSEQADARPDFIAPIYPPMTARPVAVDAPPMFLAIALDDVLFARNRNLGLIDSWRTAKRPLEVHLYEKGNHGFGLAGTSKATALWIDEFYAWMQDRRLVTVPVAGPVAAKP